MAEQTQSILQKIGGVQDVGIERIMGQTNLEFPVDRAKCARWNVNVADVQNVLATAVGGRPFTQMVEGEKTFDITLRLPERLRDTQDKILNIPVEVTNNNVTGTSVAGVGGTPLTGSSTGLTPLGTSVAMPSLTGGMFNGTLNNLAAMPRRPLRDLVTPLDANGRPDPNGGFVRTRRIDDLSRGRQSL